MEPSPWSSMGWMVSSTWQKVKVRRFHIMSGDLGRLGVGWVGGRSFIIVRRARVTPQSFLCRDPQQWNQGDPDGPPHPLQVLPYQTGLKLLWILSAVPLSKLPRIFCDISNLLRLLRKCSCCCCWIFFVGFGW